jgi:hypothetical protein
MTVFIKPFRNGISGGRKIVVIVGFIVMRQQIVIEENRVVSVFAQKNFSFFDRFGDVQIIAFKSFLKPAMTAVIVVQKENGNGRSF